MDLSGLELLKQKLIEATEFAPVWDYFMTHFGEQRAFMALGKRTRELTESFMLDLAGRIVTPPFGTRRGRPLISTDGWAAYPGAVDLAFEPENSRVIYATVWNGRRPQWSQYAPLEGPGSGLWKSTDGGDHWTQISGAGLPIRLAQPRCPGCAAVPGLRPGELPVA